VKVRAFTAAEVATLMRHADEATRVLIQTAAHTGLGIGELAGLEWSCVMRSSLRMKHGPI
jgi:integrase